MSTDESSSSSSLLESHASESQAEGNLKTTFVHDISPASSPDNSCENYVIYFITGNPGLISYYEPFLTTLSSLLSSDLLNGGSGNRRIRICGASFAGFEPTAATVTSNKTKETNGHFNYPVGLRNQILNAEYHLSDFITSFNQLNDTSTDGHVHVPPYRATTKVILIGHSVGAYVLLEMIRRNHVGLQQDQKMNMNMNMNIVGGILLFPTIADIAKSPMGKVFSVSLNSKFLFFFFSPCFNVYFFLSSLLFLFLFSSLF